MGKLLLVISIPVLILTACEDAIGDKYVSFAQCLDSKDAVFYGAYWCPHCANQKAMFGRQGEFYLPYVECDPRGREAQERLCKDKQIDGYPTWIFADGSRLSGEIQLATLAKKTGCELPKDELAQPVE